MDASKKNSTECFKLPPLVNSYGIWESLLTTDGKSIWDYTLPHLEFYIVVIFITWQLVHFLFKRLGFLKFTSQAIAGMFLSRPILELLLSEDSIKVIHPDEEGMKVILGTLGTFGYTMFWFLMGVKMDGSMIFRTGRIAMVIGVSVMLSPWAVCLGLYWNDLGSFSTYLSSQLSEVNFTYLVAVESLTPFPVVATVLSELKIQNSELGRLGLSCALVTDIIGKIISTTGSLVRMSESPQTVFSNAAAVSVFLLFCIFVFRPALFWVIRETPEGRPVKSKYIYAIVVLAIGSAVYIQRFGQYFIMGPFLLGLSVPDGPPLGSALTEKFEAFLSGIFLPMFVATCTMQIDISEVGSNFSAYLFVVMLVTIIKFMASLLPSLFYKVPLKDALALAALMNKKGIVELSSYYFVLDRKGLRPDIYAMLTSVILFNSILVPLLVRHLYDPAKKFAGYKKRNMMHMKQDYELRILVCIHKPDNLTPMINLLEASCPMKDNPIVVFVLHLVKLVGQAQPLFISHQMQKRRLGYGSYSENVVLSFAQFQREYWNLTFVNSYTSVSSPRGMHDDICMLSLDKLTSLILIPFHRTWSIDGSTLVSDDNMVRNLNCKILEKSPCSVGILIDRSRLGRRTVRESSEHSYKVCMIFLGGKDDREALTLAKRMVNQSRLTLTVLCIVSSEDDDGATDWEKKLDSSEIEDIRKRRHGYECVTYIEQVVKDGMETLSILKPMVDEYDLFIVGRGGQTEKCCTTGLIEWTIFPELGIIGDMFAWPDLDCKASVLVVQQQLQIT